MNLTTHNQLIGQIIVHFHCAKPSHSLSSFDQAYAQCRLQQGNVDISRKLLEQCVLLQRRCSNPVGECVAIATAAASLEPSIDAKPMLEKALSIAKDCHSINNCVSFLIRLGNLFA
jgi:hypothetical protein